MMGLPGIVTNPFSCGLRVVCNALEGDRVYGLVDGSHAHVIDLIAGVVYEARIGCQMLWSFGDYLDPKVYIPEVPEGDLYNEERKKKLALRDEAVQKAKKKIPFTISPFAVGFLGTITAGRVSAGDLMKGLKARGVESPCEIRNNYAGGWDFYVKNDGKDVYWTVEDFVERSFAQRADSDHS